MTTPCYPSGCAAGSKAPGEAAAWSSASAWNVNANNGNVNNNHRDNNGFALAVRRVGEFQGDQALPLEALYRAWQCARRGKVPSRNRADFEMNWSGNLIRLQRRLLAGEWLPGPSTCFVAKRPKAREIHAPDFSDRIVHHWVVPQLEAVLERKFIHDSYSNRRGKGTHAAVKRATRFMREVHGAGGGWYLQLDVRNFFNSLHRPTLWAILKRGMERGGVPPLAQRVTHALLRRPPLAAGVRYRATPGELAMVPRHKRLAAAAPGCGLPIGNLSSQFFANVYLNELDQFAKHELRAGRYLRYVDDFVLFHRDRSQLEQWLARIREFLRDRLRLDLKADIRLRRLGDGLDFLGYVIRPTHTLARKRVHQHVRESLAAWERAHVAGSGMRVSPKDLRAVKAVAASYAGHLRHCASARALASLDNRFPWLRVAAVTRRFEPRAESSRFRLSWRRK